MEARLNKIFIEEREACREIENCLCAVFIYIKAAFLSEFFSVWFSTDAEINSSRLQTKEWRALKYWCTEINYIKTKFFWEIKGI